VVTPFIIGLAGPMDYTPVGTSFTEDGDYTAEIFSDDPNSYPIETDYKQAKLKRNKTSTLKNNMAKGGGMVA
jgi:hypothetical protein